MINLWLGLSTGPRLLRAFGYEVTSADHDAHALWTQKAPKGRGGGCWHEVTGHADGGMICNHQILVRTISHTRSWLRPYNCNGDKY